MSLTACQVSGPTALIIRLDDEQTAQIVMMLQGLQTSCPGNQCGADYPDVVFVVRSAAGQSTSYNSDFYAGCVGPTLAPPFISYQALANLQILLDRIVAQACQSNTDAGVCIRGMVDAGPFDAARGE
jgi:hypothetical protein